MMTAAEVEPVQLVQIFAEAFFKGFGSRFQVIGILSIPIDLHFV